MSIKENSTSFHSIYFDYPQKQTKEQGNDNLDNIFKSQKEKSKPFTTIIPRINKQTTIKIIFKENFFLKEEFQDKKPFFKRVYLTNKELEELGCPEYHEHSEKQQNGQKDNSIKTDLIYQKDSYYDKNDEYVPLSAVLTVGELEGMVGKQIASVHKPDKDTVFECYEINNYNLYKEQDEEEMEYPERRELVFQSTKYWLASNCIWTYLGSNYVGFGMRYVDAARMGTYAAFYSFNTPAGTTFAIRPVVTLNSNVKIIENSSENDTWSISLS